jgi:hypothetical protein
MDVITPDRQLITMIDARQQDLSGYLRSARPRGNRSAPRSTLTCRAGGP